MGRKAEILVVELVGGLLSASASLWKMLVSKSLISQGVRVKGISYIGWEKDIWLWE